MCRLFLSIILFVVFFSAHAERYPERQQTPKPPFFYTSQNVKFSNDTLTFAGTLTSPWSDVVGAVVLITGSGQQNRDEEIFGHKPFAVIADFLTRCGWVVLRYDDRGVGGSSKGSNYDTTYDFATDAMAAVDYLRTISQLKGKPIGLLGHSEGGSIALINAANHPDNVDFVVTLAAPAVRGSDVMVRQNEMIAQLAGVELSSERHQRIKDIFQTINEEYDVEQLRGRLRSLVSAEYADSAIVEAQVTAMTSPWYMAFVRLNPSEFMHKIKCPLLALNGSWDVQVDAKQNLQAITLAIPTAQVKEYDGLNHLFQRPPMRQMSLQYGNISQTIEPEVLNDIATFLVGVIRNR